MQPYTACVRKRRARCGPCAGEIPQRPLLSLQTQHEPKALIYSAMGCDMDDHAFVTTTPSRVITFEEIPATPHEEAHRNGRHHAETLYFSTKERAKK